MKLVDTEDQLKIKVAEMQKTRRDLRVMEDRLEALWGSMSRERRVEEGWDPDAPPARGSRTYDYLEDLVAAETGVGVAVAAAEDEV